MKSVGLASAWAASAATMDKVAERYEVIVVDDASTDSTPQIAQEAGGFDDARLDMLFLASPQ